MTEKEENEINKRRDLVADKLDKILKKEYGETSKIYRAEWDVRRIGWESTIMSELYYSDLDSFLDILDRACDGLGVFVELINTEEGHICE